MLFPPHQYNPSESICQSVLDFSAVHTHANKRTSTRTATQKHKQYIHNITAFSHHLLSNISFQICLLVNPNLLHLNFPHMKSMDSTQTSQSANQQQSEDRLKFKKCFFKSRLDALVDDLFNLFTEEAAACYRDGWNDALAKQSNNPNNNHQLSASISNVAFPSLIPFPSASKLTAGQFQNGSSTAAGTLNSIGSRSVSAFDHTFHLEASASTMTATMKLLAGSDIKSGMFRNYRFILG